MNINTKEVTHVEVAGYGICCISMEESIDDDSVKVTTFGIESELSTPSGKKKVGFDYCPWCGERVTTKKN